MLVLSTGFRPSKSVREKNLGVMSLLMAVNLHLYFITETEITLLLT